MAGKTWSEQEEEYFWLHIIPFSRRRRGLDLANPELSFQQLAQKMRDAFGDNARRQYTALTLEEHYYQNIETGRISKNARRFVREYEAIASEYPGLPGKSNRATHRANNEVEAAHVGTKPGAETDWELGGNENTDKRAAILKLAAPADQEQTVQTEGTATADELFAGSTGAITPGYDSDRTVTDIFDEAVGGSIQQSDTEGAAEATANAPDNDNTHGAPAGTNHGTDEAINDTIIVGGFSFSEDDSSVDEDSDYQPDGDEPANGFRRKE